MPMSPVEALALLLAAPRVRPGEVSSRLPGLYLLHDHDAVPRYIGQTSDLKRRIFNNHCTGDRNSHKWVSAYNAGRLWHCSKISESNKTDGKLAKMLRAELARRFCSVRFIEMPDVGKTELEGLEARVRAIAPDPMNDRKAVPPLEPENLVDRILAEDGWSAAQRAALDRQARRWRDWSTDRGAA